MPCGKRQTFSPEMAAEESDLFDSLPDDLVISILSKLSSSAGCPSDFVTVLMTCKRLNRLALHSLVLSKGSSKMLPIKAKNWSKSAYRFLKLCADAGNAEGRCALLLLEEEKRIFSEELEKLGKAIEEDLANQYIGKEIQMPIFSKDLLVTLGEDLGFAMLQTGGLEGVTAMNSGGPQNLEMIQTGGLEGVTAVDSNSFGDIVNSSSFGAMGNPFERAEELKRKREEELDEAHQGKRPATAYTTPSRPPIGGFMAEARQNYGQSAAALANQGSLVSTNEGTQIQMREAAHDKEASTSSWVPPQVEPRMFTGDELGLGSKNEFQLKETEAFCEEPGIDDMFKDSREKEEQEFMEELKKLEEVLMKDGTNELFDMDILLDLPDLEMWTAYMTVYFEGELQSSTTWTTPLTAGAMNSTTGEPHHDPLGMQGGTAAAGSSGDPTTQSSPHNEKV
ncbi:hypothetical protein SLEP1_g53054 [Rubroshorea leprosula]|uniref:F-box domain-containing protein n=1 Tax=Rubroshorea leprosula TaxID=152421 RepID=A0AAV5M882_9ROSI|nr:hypothetical protein SLEP1_g53054 [Rubroshorea leprosula]